jgi:hypothetical protein
MAVAMVVYVYADKLARLALARPQQMVFESDIPASEWQALAFSVVGLWQAIAGVIGLTTHLVGMLIAHSQMASAGMAGDWPPSFTEALITSSMQLLLGLVVLFGARGLVGLLRRYRQIGDTRPEAAMPSDPGEHHSPGPGQPPQE